MEFEDAMDKGCRNCLSFSYFSGKCHCSLYEQDIEEDLPCKIDSTVYEVDEMELKAGKLYSFPLTIPSDGREKEGLFTGEYADNGNAILMTKNGERWSVPKENLHKG